MDTGCYGTERSWPLLSTTKVFHGLVYIDDVLTHGKTDPEFLTNEARCQRHEDAHSTGAQVATENLSQDFLILFAAFSWLVFPLGF